MFIYLINLTVDILANIPKAIGFSRNVPVQNQLCCQIKNPEEGHGWGLKIKRKQWLFPPCIWSDLRTLNSSLCTNVSLREQGRVEPAEAIFNWMDGSVVIDDDYGHSIYCGPNHPQRSPAHTLRAKMLWLPRLLACVAHTENLSETASQSWQPRLTPEICFSCLIQPFLFFWNSGLLPNPIILALFLEKPHWGMCMQCEDR